MVANLAVMGASVSTNPFNLVWQLLWIFYGLTAGAAVGLVSTILVVLPVLDARSAAKVCVHSATLPLVGLVAGLTVVFHEAQKARRHPKPEISSALRGLIKP